MGDGFKSRLSGWMDLRPRRGLERAAFWLLAWFLLLSAMRWIPGVIGGLAAGLQITVGVVLLMVAIPLLWTTIRMRLLWSLRNKLVLTYLLIGLAPVVLIITLVLVAAYVAAGQFAIHLVDARVTSYLMQMGSENEARFRRLQPMVEGHSTRESMNAEMPPDERPSGVPSRFRRDTTCFLEGTSVFHVASPRRAPLGLAPWATEVRGGRFHGIVSDGGELYLVALHQQRLNDGRMFTVMSSIPLERDLIDLFAEGLGIVRLLPEKTEAKQANSDPAPGSPATRRNGQHFLSETRGGADPRGVNVADIRVWFPSTLAMTDWAVGQPDNVVLEVDSRPSLLYQQLFGASLSGWVMTVIRVSLTLLVFIFGALWLTAFVMAVRLTRTMTESVADLYDATLRVDRGDLEHKIVVKRTDQLAELSRSFNNMTGSLQRLLLGAC